MQEIDQNRAEQQLMTVRNVQYAEMMNTHYQTHFKMLRNYSRPWLIGDISDEPDDYDEGAPVWRIGDCKLAVVPFGRTDRPYRWVLVDTPTVMFRAPLNRVIVYFSIPISVRDRSAELTLEDEVYWIEDAKVMAAGMVDSVLHGNTIITDEALIVPVVVKPFIHQFVPFSMRDAGYGENIEHYEAFEAEHVAMDSGRQILLPGIPPEWKPAIAIELDPVIGLDLLCYIDDDYNSNLLETSTITS